MFMYDIDDENKSKIILILCFVYFKKNDFLYFYLITSLLKHTVTVIRNDTVTTQSV